MEVTVKLFAYFRDGRFKEAASTLSDEETTPRNVIESLAIDMDDVGVIMVNNRHAAADYRLHNNDVLAIFPRIGGG
ncbi:MAG: MoaD/ThiS family protein [Desulfobulbus sp.]|nr:MAG: MoaD/ThiS family protein [Desulfobulbus sp.]RUM38360.1 MAG: MoaD/ThiS family protein [Desulfobulbus sp.]